MTVNRRAIISLLAAASAIVPAYADPVLYAVNAFQQFGVIDVETGVFTQIGSNTPEVNAGLVPGPNGTLTTLTVSGNLDSINPATGVATLVGATGLGDCSTPASPCGPTAASTIGMLNGQVYATDLQNDLYRINQATGAATLIRATVFPGLPADFVPAALNPDGTVNIYDQALFGFAGNLFSTFDAYRFDFGTGTETAVVSPNLYRIDPLTGIATLVGPTEEANLGAAVAVNGSVYAFDNVTSQIFTLDVTNGSTTFVSDFDPAFPVVLGASPVPEPRPLALSGIGILIGLFWRWRKIGSPNR
jgi:hypothetical protein